MSSLTQIKLKQKHILIVVKLVISEKILEIDQCAEIAEIPDIEFQSAEIYQEERISNATLVTALRNQKKGIIEQSIPQIIGKMKT